MIVDKIKDATMFAYEIKSENDFIFINDILKKNNKNYLDITYRDGICVVFYRILKDYTSYGTSVINTNFEDFLVEHVPHLIENNNIYIIKNESEIKSYLSPLNINNYLKSKNNIYETYGVIKNYKLFTESLLNKLEGPNFKELIKNFGGINKLLDFAINKGENDIITQIYDIKKEDKEVYNRIRNYACKNLLNDLLLKIYIDKKDEDKKINEFLLGYINNDSRNFDSAKILFLEALLDNGFTFTLSDLNINMIYYIHSSKKIEDYIISLYEKRKKRFFLNTFNDDELYKLDYMLEIALKKNDVKLINKIYSINNLKNYNHKFGIRSAVFNGNIEALKTVFKYDGGVKLSDFNYLIDALNRIGYVSDVVDLLLEYNYPIETEHIIKACNNYDSNNKNNLIIFKKLLNHFNKIDNNIITLINFRYADIFDVLFDYGYDVHFNDDYVLNEACELNKLDIADVALKHGANPNSRRGEIIYSPLFFGNYDIIKLLLDNGYNFLLPRKILKYYSNLKPNVKELVDRWYEGHPEVEDELNNYLPK